MKSAALNFRNLPTACLVALVKAYRLLLSPVLGSSCRFEPTCSAYSLEALQQYGAGKGSYLTLRRLARCHPWCEGGLDPVPAPTNTVHAACLTKRSALFTSLVTSVIPSSSEKKSS